ncbi:MAG: hypothetical protein Q7K43_05420 [Candidatus Woesearchaeota archaeon]|nr:hypothetical protein [Candidatus Woesearchaeota archaeon]
MSEDTMSKDRYDGALADIYSDLKRPTHAAFILQERGSVVDFLYSQGLSPFAFENLDSRVVDWYRSSSMKKLPKSLPSSVQINLIAEMREYGKRNLADIPTYTLFWGTTQPKYIPKRSRIHRSRLKRGCPAE